MPEETMNQMHEQMNEQLNRISAPAQRLTALMLNNAERLSDFQMESMQNYAHLAFSQMRDALSIHDPQSLQSFLEKQNRYANEYSRCLSQDAERLAGIGRDFTTQAQQVAQQNMSTLSDAARRATERTSQQVKETTDKAEREAQRTTRKSA